MKWIRRKTRKSQKLLKIKLSNNVLALTISLKNNSFLEQAPVVKQEAKPVTKAKEEKKGSILSKPSDTYILPE